MNGILNVAKPAGMTSFGVVARVRRWSGERRVGHAGTLDPDASGVLPLLLGHATRVVQFLTEARKVYLARVILGAATDTYDASGNVTSTGDASSLTRGDVEEALGAFRGTIEQVPPMYSAVKHQGQRLYRLARAGQEVARQPRTVQVYRADIVGWELPTVVLGVECGRGTYLRSLAHDLGQALGCGAHLGGLVRTRYGPFDLQEAASLEAVEKAFRMGTWRSLLQPLDTVLQHLEAINVDEGQERALGYGQPVSLEKAPARGQVLRAYAHDGWLVALLRSDAEAGVARPTLVFRRDA